MIIKKYKLLSFVALFSGLTLQFSFGAVSLGGQFFDTYVPGTYVSDSQVDNAVTSFTINAADLGTQSFSAAGNDKLVLAISTKWASNSGGAVTSLTYDGASLTNVVARKSNRAQDEIWYLDNVSSDGDINLTFDSVTEGFAIYLFALNGTKAGFQDSAEANGTLSGANLTPELTSTVAGSFVLWEVSDNWGVVSYGGDYSTVASTFGGRGGSRGLWNIEGAAGTFQEAHTGGRSDTGQVGAVFEAIPEPSAALFGVFCALMLLRRRRHKA